MTVNNLKILLLAPFGRSGGVTEYSKTLAKMLEKSGASVIRTSTQVSGRGIVKGIKQPVHIVMELINKRKNYEVISVQLASNWGFMPGIVAVTAGKLLGRRVISTYHGGGYKRFISHHPFVFKYVMGGSEIFLVASEAMKRDIGNKFPKYKTLLQKTSNGYDSEIFRPIDANKCIKKLRIPENKTIILSVGGLYPVKGHKYLIEAMKIVHETKPEALCYIVGDGPERKRLEKHIKEKDMGLKGIVNLVGARLHDEISVWMNACDIFVLPSLNEGNPTVMFEALACGKPFIGTTVGGIPEIIRDEKLGILVPPKDSEALAKAILRALERKWDANYIMKYAEQFTWKNIAKQIIDLYSEFMNS